MAKAEIYSDESYHARIFRVKTEDEVDRFPPLYLPVEIPEDRLAEYEAAVQAELALRRQIIADFGESPVNPHYHEMWDLYMAETAEVEDAVERVADQEQAEEVWSEYFEGTGR